MKQIEIFRVCTYPRVKKGMYSISTRGRIKNNINGKIRTIRSKSSNGYYHTSLCTDVPYKYVWVCIHRLVAWEFVDGYDESLGHVQVNHLDVDTFNNHYKNLEWTDVSGNQKHSYACGREIIVPDTRGPRPTIYGSNNPNCKFSEDYVRKMCSLIQEGFTNIEILYILDEPKNSPAHTLVKNLRKKKTWKHIVKEYVF